MRYYVQCLNTRNVYRRYYSDSLPDVCAIISIGFVGVSVSDSVTHETIESYYLPIYKL
jgi:hypothetical protein